MFKTWEDQTIWHEYYEEFPCFSEQTVREGCQPRKMEHAVRSEKAIILIHGLSDSPHFLRAIGEFFHFKLGYDVYLPLLQGHGLNSPAKMKGVSLAAWKENVEFAISVASTSENSISIGGLSTGGTLGFYMSAVNPAVNGDLYLFSAALGLPEGWLGIGGTVREFLLRLPFIGLLDGRRKPPIGPNPYRYDYVSLSGAKELCRLISEVKNLIRSFRINKNYKKRIFSVSSEYDDVVSLGVINRLGQIAAKDQFVQQIIRKSLKVEHACVVLKSPIYAADTPFGEPPLEKPNPEFPQIMADIRGFQN